jgi:peptidoglycan hydrolase CwlO-like protein
MIYRLLLIALVLSLVLPLAGQAQTAETQTEVAKELTSNQQLIQDKQQEIEELNKKIAELRTQRDSTAAEAEAVNVQVRRLQQKVAKAELELKQTQLAIRSVVGEQKQTEKDITTLQQDIESKRDQLRALIQQIHSSDQASWVSIFLSNLSLGAVLAERATYAELQARTVQVITDMRTTEQSLRETTERLADEQRQLQGLASVLGEQQDELEAQRNEQQTFLRKKRSEQVAYENELALAQQTRKEIEQAVFTLKGAGVKLTLTEATDMARYASQLTGVRAALLLGVLKVETNVGTNLGSGRFPDDMHPAGRDAFLRVTKKLGLDPRTAPISARPRSYQGWGGAMGPGQFMPDTWERIEERLQKLLGHQPNPYNLTDAFVATALFLADKGAADPAKEYEAVNRYLAGPNWQRFTWYGDRVLAVAKEYEKEGIR